MHKHWTSENRKTMLEIKKTVPNKRVAITTYCIPFEMSIEMTYFIAIHLFLQIVEFPLWRKKKTTRNLWRNKMKRQLRTKSSGSLKIRCVYLFLVPSDTFQRCCRRHHHCCSRFVRFFLLLLPVRVCVCVCLWIFAVSFPMWNVIQIDERSKHWNTLLWNQLKYS